MNKPKTINENENVSNNKTLTQDEFDQFFLNMTKDHLISDEDTKSINNNISAIKSDLQLLKDRYSEIDKIVYSNHKSFLDHQLEIKSDIKDLNFKITDINKNLTILVKNCVESELSNFKDNNKDPNINDKQKSLMSRAVSGYEARCF